MEAVTAPFQVFNAPNPQGVFAVTPLGSIDLAAGVITSIDSLLTQALRHLQSDIQSVWIDASFAAAAVQARVQSSRQYTVWPPGAVGWQPLTMPMTQGAGTRLELYTTIAATIGVAVATGVVWQTPFDANVIKSLGGIVATVTSISASASAQQFLAANAQRAGASVYNDSAATLYLLEGDGTASSTNFSAKLFPNDYYETPFNNGARLSGVWGSATGAARVTEYT